MITMRQHRVNGSRFVQVCTLLELAQEQYAEGLDTPYDLMYTMFPGEPREVITEILEGTRKVFKYPAKNYLLVNFEGDDI